MSDVIAETRQRIAAFALELFNRHLTDAAGGNVSVRIGDTVLMTPKLAGTMHHWNLRPEQILILDLDGNKLEGEGEVSREAKVHFALLKEFYPTGTSVIHAHARNVLVFCAAEKPMPPVMYATKKFGEIPQCRDAASGTDDLAEYVLEAILPNRDQIAKGGAAAMAPRHGLFVIGKDIFTAFDSTERIDTNAYCILQAAAIGGAWPLGESTAVANPNYE